MLHRYIAFLIAVTVMLSMLAGCATRIGNQGSLEETVFEIGKTTKHEVANTLGLPGKMKKNEVSGAELWAYQEEPILVSTHEAALDPLGQITTKTYWATDIFVNDFKNAAVVYGFNDKGILVNVKRNKQNKR